MKISLFVLFVSFISINVNAQLANTKWKGIAEIPEPLQCLFYFKTDTLLVQYADDKPMFLRDENGNSINVTGKDSVVIETMTYNFSGDTLTLTKIKGGSPCEGGTTGQYKITINNNRLLFTLIQDDCDARAEAFVKNLAPKTVSKWLDKIE
jgi:hypothetical protein